MTDTRFDVNPRVVHETIDREVILVHIETGLYYSLAESAADIWTLLAAGHSVDETSEALGLRYVSSLGDRRDAVLKLARELEGEGLLRTGAGSQPLVEASLEPARNGGVPLTEPVLERYEDMQEFLLVDPIHDVDETAGWPVKKSD